MDKTRHFFHIGTIIMSGIISFLGFSFKDQELSLIVMGMGTTLAIISLAWMDIIYKIEDTKGVH